MQIVFLFCWVLCPEPETKENIFPQPSEHISPKIEIVGSFLEGEFDGSNEMYSALVRDPNIKSLSIKHKLDIMIYIIDSGNLYAFKDFFKFCEKSKENITDFYLLAIVSDHSKILDYMLNDQNQFPLEFDINDCFESASAPVSKYLLENGYEFFQKDIKKRLLLPREGDTVDFLKFILKYYKGNLTESWIRSFKKAAEKDLYSFNAFLASAQFGIEEMKQSDLVFEMTLEYFDRSPENLEMFLINFPSCFLDTKFISDLPILIAKKFPSRKDLLDFFSVPGKVENPVQTQLEDDEGVLLSFDESSEELLDVFILPETDVLSETIDDVTNEISDLSEIEFDDILENVFFDLETDGTLADESTTISGSLATDTTGESAVESLATCGSLTVGGSLAADMSTAPGGSCDRSTLNRNRTRISRSVTSGTSRVETEDEKILKKIVVLNLNSLEVYKLLVVEIKKEIEEKGDKKEDLGFKLKSFLNQKLQAEIDNLKCETFSTDYFDKMEKIKEIDIDFVPDHQILFKKINEYMNSLEKNESFANTFDGFIERAKKIDPNFEPSKTREEIATEIYYTKILSIPIDEDFFDKFKIASRLFHYVSPKKSININPIVSHIHDSNPIESKVKHRLDPSIQSAKDLLKHIDLFCNDNSQINSHALLESKKKHAQSQAEKCKVVGGDCYLGLNGAALSYYGTDKISLTDEPVFKGFLKAKVKKDTNSSPLKCIPKETVWTEDHICGLLMTDVFKSDTFEGRQMQADLLMAKLKITDRIIKLLIEYCNENSSFRLSFSICFLFLLVIFVMIS